MFLCGSGSPEENLRQIYRVFDINNDSSISLKELQRVVKALSKLISENDMEQLSQEVIARTGIT